MKEIKRGSKYYFKARTLIPSIFYHPPNTHHIFKDKGQRLARVDNVVQRHDVAVFQFFQQ